MGKSITLTPYITFDGNCEEALSAYAKILNGKVTIAQRYDAPAMQMPKEFHNKVLHAVFEFDGNKIFASDAMPTKGANRGSSDASMSLDVPGPEEGKKIFDQLAQGGKVHVLFEKQFWGAWHGNLTDKFGIKWMVNCEEK